MRVLALETSCDETACAVVEGSLKEKVYSFSTLGASLNSQAHLHAEFGGVYPTLAKREHVRNLVPLIADALTQAGFNKAHTKDLNDHEKTQIYEWLSHESEHADAVITLAEHFDPKDLDGIAVTSGPGLEPALWVGINVARALAYVWKLPLVPVHHMEGHFLSGLYEGGSVEYPVLALLVSGGHTELVLSKKPFQYEVIGSTRDDASGEAFDKGARLLGLPYPGGVELSKRALSHREMYTEHKPVFNLPRPMISSPNLDFSFSGLKTSLLYLLRDLKEERKDLEELLPVIAREYEDAIVDVLVKKTQKALEETGARTLIVAGGVSANTELRKRVETLCHSLDIPLKIPPLILTGDNAVMIGFAGSLRLEHGDVAEELTLLRARGNISL